MADRDMIDDIKALLDGDFGDDRILKEIYRACKNGEVVSNYERGYVRDLVGRYLRRDVPGDDAPGADGPGQAAPDVLLPGMQPAGSGSGAQGGGGVPAATTAGGALGASQTAAADATAIAATPTQNDGSAKFISSSVKKTRGPSRMIMVAVAAGVVLALAVAAVALTGTTPDDPPGIRTLRRPCCWAGRGSLSGPTSGRIRRVSSYRSWVCLTCTSL